jgi:integrase
MAADEIHQRSFAELQPDPGWASTRPPSPKVELPPLSEGVQGQLRQFEAALVAQGSVEPGSAVTYRRLLTQVVRQAGRHLGRPLNSLDELYVEGVIAAVAADEAPLLRAAPLTRRTKRAQRVALQAYLRAVGLTGRTFEEACAILDRGFRRAARRGRASYLIRAGRPSQDGYRPPLEDVRRFLQAARGVGNSFAGARLAAAAALALWHGLRSVSLEAIAGTDFQWRRGALFLMVTEKAVGGKRGRREEEVRGQVVPYLQRYIRAHNSDPTRKGWRQPVGFGLAGPFFRTLGGGPWRGQTIRSAYRRCCRAAAIAAFAPHSLRRAYGSGLAALLPIEEAPTAGGWRNPRVFLDHYARPMVDWQPRLPWDEPSVDLDDDRPTPSAAGASEEEVREQ